MESSFLRNSPRNVHWKSKAPLPQLRQLEELWGTIIMSGKMNYSKLFLSSALLSPSLFIIMSCTILWHTKIYFSDGGDKQDASAVFLDQYQKPKKVILYAWRYFEHQMFEVFNNMLVFFGPWGWIEPLSSLLQNCQRPTHSDIVWLERSDLQVVSYKKIWNNQVGFSDSKYSYI